MRRVLPFSGGAAAAVAAVVAATAGFGLTGGEPACAQSGDAVVPRLDCPGGANGRGTSVRCTTTTLLRSASVRPGGQGLRARFVPRGRPRVTVTIFQNATTNRVVDQRIVFKRSARRGPIRWNGRRQAGRPAAGDGVFFVRIRAQRGSRQDTRRFAMRRTAGRFRAERAFARRDGCGRLQKFKLSRPAFGGTTNRPVSVAFRLARRQRVVLELRRNGRTVRRLSRSVRRAGRLHRVRIVARGLPRGRYEVRIRGSRIRSSVFVRRV